MISNPLERIKELAEPLVSQSDMFLVDVEIKQQEMPVVWVLVDSENGGVNLDECTKLNKELSFLVESEEIFEKSYRLNVSSPGLSRPLTDKRQYAKNRGRTARIKFKKDGSYEKAEGILKEVSDDLVKIEQNKGNEVSIRFEDLVETKIVPKI
ncbi:ribosome maturation factor [Rhodohalobacter sp. SW132]|uniref:ribosome maturation factor RimP n=1 Tax=Rhodohalobacter sp. SW132 TaxID=2293433 RepID=UPI000E21D6E2|nr:ribosome maturation factor [Rhodohalobacter sp. SW132]REL33631.1 ribosome maturation factor [Rhodohalobacter sp. SW132]